MHSHIAEVFAESRFHETSRAGIEWLTRTAAEYGMDDRRNARPGMYRVSPLRMQQPADGSIARYVLQTQDLRLVGQDLRLPLSVKGRRRLSLPSNAVGRASLRFSSLLIHLRSRSLVGLTMTMRQSRFGGSNPI